MLGSATVTQCRGIAPAPGCGWGIKEAALGKWCWVLAWMGPGLKKKQHKQTQKRVPNPAQPPEGQRKTTPQMHSLLYP